MNLLEATTTLIDAVKTYAPEDDRAIARAVKRMEKRLLILQVRAAKRRKANRVKAFWQAMALFNGSVCDDARVSKKQQACFICPSCRKLLFWGDFIRSAQISPGGRFESTTCPHCLCELCASVAKP